MEDNYAIPPIEFSRRNLWCVSTSLADLIARMMKEFRSSCAGHPVYLTDKNEWDKVLRGIQRGFEAVGPLMDDFSLSDRKRAKLEKRFEKGMKLFNEHYFALWS